jgi:hypothetical protein
MAPFKSSLARSVGKLLGVYKDTDLSLRGDLQSTRKPPGAEATGGRKFTSGGQTYHLFHSNSTLVVDSGAGSLSATVFLVAGGGSGVDGGGGAGGVRDVPGVTLEAGETWTCIVGGGGASTGPAGQASNRPGWDSSNAQSNPIVGKHTDFYFQPVSYPNPKYYRAIGGGRGGVWGSAGGPGGSGGGAGNRTDGTQPGGLANTIDSTPTPAPNQYGNAGGPGTAQSVDDIGGGGGGAGGAGTEGSAPVPTDTRGNGGAGAPFPAYASPIIGPQLTAAGVPGPEVTAFNTAVGPTGIYGGGGGGGGRSPGDNTGTTGGAGGGGNYQAGPPHLGTTGIKYTGGGGAGGGLVGSTYGPGGGGGTGIIIIKYPTP